MRYLRNVFRISSLSRKRYQVGNLAIILAAMAFISCEKEPPKTTYITGKIINPQSDYVVFQDFQDLNDTVPLDAKGRFSKKYDQFNSGFIFFSHPNEYQSIFINKGDSIVLRVNTKSFDESIAFSGSRSIENNYLMDQFVKTEISNRALFNEYRDSPQQFYDKLQSKRKERIAYLEDLASSKKFDKQFVKQAKTIINLNAYSRLERYPFTHYGKNEILKCAELPDRFTSHRKEFDLNDSSLLNLYSFRPYVNGLVSQMALVNCAKMHGSGKHVDRSGYEYRREKIKIIDSLFSNQKTKELFIVNETRNFIRNSKNAVEINRLVQDFLKISKDLELNKSVKKLAGTYQQIIPGKKLENFTISNVDNMTMQLEERIDKMSVLFFWSQEFPENAIHIHNKVRDLRNKYPEIDFIGINIDDTDTDNWKKVNARYRFEINSEYQLNNFRDVMAYLELQKENRTLVIDEDLSIVNPDLNLFHYKIETTLLGYLNR